MLNEALLFLQELSRFACRKANETFLDALDREERWCQGCWFERLVVEMCLRSHEEGEIKERVAFELEVGWGRFDLMSVREWETRVLRFIFSDESYCCVMYLAYNFTLR